MVPEDSYAMSKVCNEVSARCFQRRTGADIYGLRINNVVEPHEYEQHFPGHFAEPARRRRNVFAYIDARWRVESGVESGVERCVLPCRVVVPQLLACCPRGAKYAPQVPGAALRTRDAQLCRLTAQCGCGHEARLKLPDSAALNPQTHTHTHTYIYIYMYPTRHVTSVSSCTAACSRTISASRSSTRPTTTTRWGVVS